MSEQEFLNKLMKDFENYVSLNYEIKREYDDYIIDLYLENKNVEKKDFQILINKKDFYFDEFRFYVKEKLPAHPFKPDYKDINYEKLYEIFDKLVDVEKI